MSFIFLINFFYLKKQFSIFFSKKKGRKIELQICKNFVFFKFFWKIFVKKYFTL